MPVKLTKTYIDSLPYSDKTVFVRDSELLGFALRITTQSKTYIAEKRLPLTSKVCRVTIGRHGVWTVQQAREKAREYLLMIAQGIDPNAIKSETVSQNKFNKRRADACPSLAEAYAFYKSRKTLADSTIKTYDVCMRNYFSDWHDIKLNAISEQMIIDRHLAVSERSKAQANLASKFLSALYSHTILRYRTSDGEKLGLDNRAAVIKEEKALHKIRRRKTYIRAEQLSDWSHGVFNAVWLGESGDDFRANTNRDYLFLLILTGLRRSEAEKLQWSQVDLRFGTISIKDTKNHEPLILPVGDTLWAILRTRKASAGHTTYVFADRLGQSHIVDRRDIRDKVKDSTGIEFTFHDLRRTFSSVANGLAIGSYTIKQLINHTAENDNSDVTHGYVQVSFDDLRHAMNLIEQKILPDDIRQALILGGMA